MKDIINIKGMKTFWHLNELTGNLKNMNFFGKLHQEGTITRTTMVISVSLMKHCYQHHVNAFNTFVVM